MSLSENQVRELAKIARGLERGLGEGGHIRVVVDDDGGRWWRELGALDRRTLPALERRRLVELRLDDRSQFRAVWQARLTELGRQELREAVLP